VNAVVGEEPHPLSSLAFYSPPSQGIVGTYDRVDQHWSVIGLVT